jgi:hypothetical protein
MASVGMTLQSDAIVERLDGLPGLALGPFGHGRLTADPDWLAVVNPLQAVLYGVSAILLLAALASQAVPWEVKLFVAMVVLGILVNAFVCGALSQPATRYGARVIWLLPTTAVLAASFLLRRPATAPAAQEAQARQGGAP